MTMCLCTWDTGLLVGTYMYVHRVQLYSGIRIVGQFLQGPQQVGVWGLFRQGLHGVGGSLLPCAQAPQISPVI